MYACVGVPVGGHACAHTYMWKQTTISRNHSSGTAHLGF